MGQTATEIEFDIERQRHALTARISRLERRVREDVHSTRTRTSDHVAGLKHSVLSTGENAARKVGSVAGTTAGSGTALAEHPKTLVAGAAAGGALLGLATGGQADGDRTSRSSKRGEPKKGAQGRGGGGPFSSLGDLARGFIASRATSLVEAVVDSAKSSLKASVTGKGKDSRERTTDDDGFSVHTSRPPQLREGAPVGRPDLPGL